MQIVQYETCVNMNKFVSRTFPNTDCLVTPEIHIENGGALVSYFKAVALADDYVESGSILLV